MNGTKLLFLVIMQLDIIPTQALAHVASAEGITCVEKSKECT